MKAAIVTAPGATPIYGDFEEPVANPGEELIEVHAAALSHFTRSRATGAHYSSGDAFPRVAGSDGVGTTRDGRLVYFAIPEAPFGSFAQLCLVDSRRCVELPPSLDAVTAAAIANPGMSAWAGLVERAHLIPGETVLVNGATGTAGRLAVQLAKYLGAAKVIATGRNAVELESLRQLGADEVIPFSLGDHHPNGAKHYEQDLKQVFAEGIDVVLDYLWGESAKTILIAIAKAVEDAHPVRFVHLGEASGEPTIDLPGAALRSSALVLMGSGVKSVPLERLLGAIRSVFEAVGPAALKIETTVLPLAQIESVWDKAGARPRVVFSI